MPEGPSVALGDLRLSREAARAMKAGVSDASSPSVISNRSMSGLYSDSISRLSSGDRASGEDPESRSIDGGVCGGDACMSLRPLGAGVALVAAPVALAVFINTHQHGHHKFKNGLFFAEQNRGSESSLLV